MKFAKTCRAVICVSLVLLLSLFPLCAAAEQNADSAFVESTVTLTEAERAYIKQHPTVVMAADASWRPFEYLNGDSYAGIIAEITLKIERLTGLQIDYMVADSYTAALTAVQTGEADIISGLAYDEVTAQEYNVLLSSPYLTVNSAVVSNKELTNLYQESEHKTIAVVAGDYANTQIDKGIANSTLIECASNEACLDAIRDKKADMAIIASYCAEYYLGIPKYSAFHNHLMPDFNWQMSFGISKSASPLLVSILNKGIEAMSQADINDAVYKGIMDAEYSNDVLEFVYKHPLLIIGITLAVVLVIGLLVYILLRSKKKEHMRQLQDGMRLKLALERTHLCIWELDVASRKITKIDNEQEKHGFGDLRENIPQSALEKGYIHPDDVKYVQDVLERVRSGEQDVQGCWRVKQPAPDDAKNSTYWWEQVLFHIIFDEHGRPVTAIGVSEDVTKEKDAQRDALTSVYNRSSFEQKAGLILNERRNSYLQCAFVMLDLDGFKQINDTYGHGTGDKTLICVGAALNKTFRSTDIVGRLGGDEFTVFMTSVSKREDVDKKAQELVENVRKIAADEGFPFATTCSVGIAMGTKGREDLASMYKKADLALYEAKRAGKNGYSIYETSSKRKLLVADDIEMNRAILKKTLSAEYDIVEAENGAQALERLEENSDICAVITDIVMPKMDGIELIKRIRAADKYRALAIIAVTQYGDIAQEKEIIALGVDDFVYKAATPEVIQLRVRNVLKGK